MPASQGPSPAPRLSRPLRLGVTGGNGLLARELAELLPNSPLASPGPAIVRHFAPPAGASDPGASHGPARQEKKVAAQLAELGGEAVVLEPLTAASFEGLDAVFFTADAAETQTWAPRAAAAGAITVDVTSAPAASSAAKPASPGESPSRRPLALRVPHPAAQALAAVLPALARLGVQRTAATIFPPASERGMEGIEELRDQSLRLLAVQSLPTAVFDAQIAFNLRTALGEEAHPSLADVAAVIAADLRALADGFALPAIHLLQAPIFHAYFVSVLAEWDQPPAEEDLIAALRAAPACFYPREEPQPAPAATAGENGVQLGAPSRDPIHPGAFWIPLSADNLRLRAAAALHLAAAALDRL